jgi:hypothetical protein
MKGHMRCGQQRSAGAAAFFSHKEACGVASWRLSDTFPLGPFEQDVFDLPHDLFREASGGNIEQM